MGYRGRYQLGVEIPLGILTVNGSSLPSFPTTAPLVEVWSATAQVIPGRKMPVVDRFGTTGLFGLNLFLDARFSAGMYTAIYRYTVGSYQGQEEDVFEVVAGGDPAGSVIAMAYYDRPHAKFCVMQLDSGRLISRRNPRV
jgi:hypothetical protein